MNRHSALATPICRAVPSSPSTAVRFRNVLYNIPDSLELTAEHHFRLFDTHAFLYDFTPDSLSAIRSLADPAYARLFPVDRRGYSRLADGAPDAGAYEGQYQ